MRSHIDNSIRGFFKKNTMFGLKLDEALFETNSTNLKQHLGMISIDTMKYRDIIAIQVSVTAFLVELKDVYIKAGKELSDDFEKFESVCIALGVISNNYYEMHKLAYRDAPDTIYGNEPEDVLINLVGDQDIDLVQVVSGVDSILKENGEKEAIAFLRNSIPGLSQNLANTLAKRSDTRHRICTKLTEGKKL